MKKQSRALSIATASVCFQAEKPCVKKSTKLVGVVQRGPATVERIAATEVVVDTLEITDAVAELLRSGKEKKLSNIHVVFSKSTFLAGFAVFDLHRFYCQTGVPAISIMVNKPDRMRLEAALHDHFSDATTRLALLDKQGPVKDLGDGLFFQSPDLSREQAATLIKPFIHAGKLPEGLRLAGMISKLL